MPKWILRGLADCFSFSQLALATRITHSPASAETSAINLRYFLKKKNKKTVNYLKNLLKIRFFFFQDKTEAEECKRGCRFYDKFVVDSSEESDEADAQNDCHNCKTSLTESFRFFTIIPFGFDRSLPAGLRR